MINRVFLSLGSNINKEHNLPTAVALLRNMCRVTAVSSIYETAPMGLETQPDFWNAAVFIETELNAVEIKQQIINTIESQLNRQRTAEKNAPRTIDLDIALFNDQVFDYLPDDGRSRHIPDPDLLRFPHAIAPVADLAPKMLHPETGQSLATIFQELSTVHMTDGRMPIRRCEEILL